MEKFNMEVHYEKIGFIFRYYHNYGMLLVLLPEIEKRNEANNTANSNSDRSTCSKSHDGAGGK
jgi:hypothetical protein